MSERLTPISTSGALPLRNFQDCLDMGTAHADMC